MRKNPELSVIVPVLNEEETLPVLFETLAGQQEVTCELIVSDGGSGDNGPHLFRRLASTAPFPARLIAADRGRGFQMNAGAAASAGEVLLFLHADSRFTDRFALRASLDHLEKEIGERGDIRAAGRFSLRFDRDGAPPSLPYYFYESKARMDRPECTHGDQGFMLRRGFYEEVGPFDGSLPMLAETRFADRVRSMGRWLRFPAEIVTSPRRFLSEGLYERQVINAITMNFAAIGWDPFFREIPSVYRPNGGTGRLPLASTLRRIRTLVSSLPPRERLRLWYSTGAYVRSQAWQIPFFIDSWLNYARGLPPGSGKTPLLDFHDRFLDLLTDHPVGRSAAALLTFIWFHAARLHAATR